MAEEQWERKYSCDTAAETWEWIKDIADFLIPYSFIINAHVVNVFKDHWPTSLKEFVRTLKSLVYPRERVDLKKVFPNFHATSLNSVLAQGMNLKKNHEVEDLSAVVNFIARTVRADAVINVGAGQVTIHA
ncbi:hypothetical protein PTKIN_Ptkin14bG0224700 [Pterospermum kingtungense]